MFGLVLLLVLVIFLLSNRGPASLTFWPFGFLIALPIGAVVIAALVIGFFAGLVVHLPKRIGASRRARRAEKRATELETRLAAFSPPSGGTAPGSPAPGSTAPPVPLLTPDR